MPIRLVIPLPGPFTWVRRQRRHARRGNGWMVLVAIAYTIKAVTAWFRPTRPSAPLEPLPYVEPLPPHYYRKDR